VIKELKLKIWQYKILLENFSFLSILQVSNLLIFLVITPYLFRVLGKEYYGMVIFAQTVATYFSILVNFGFTVTATRDISINRNNSRTVSEIISTVLTLKIIFFVLSMVILVFLLLTIPIFKSQPRLFLFSMLACLSDALFPIWYFQGIEKMKYISLINIFTRIFSAILIFFLVINPGDFIFVPLLLGSGYLLGALIGLWIVFYKHKHKFIFQTINNLKLSVKENFPMFISNISTQIYVNANKLISGSYLGMQELAIYDIADKITYLLKIPVVMIGQTLFPRVSHDRDIRFLKKAMRYVFIFIIVIYLVVFILSRPIINFFSGTINPEAENLLRLLSVSLLPICLGLFFAELLLIPFGKFIDYTRMRAFSLLLYLTIILLLFSFKQISLFQLAITIIVVETFVLFYSYYLCKKNKIL